ncbi:MAG: hypothetical protein FJ240_06735 [Nitrospira sp.]|nr:hypothetical protein [Nitrospira sp.]
MIIKVKLSVIITLMIFLITPSAFAYTPFWDFRQWDTPQKPIYKEYMNRFVQHRITALVLMDKSSMPPFQKEQYFLADANKYGVNVWLRTNRVTPKRGIPGLPNGTLDFALNGELQMKTLEYLDQLAALSKKFPNLKGLIIGGEEIVGAHISKKELSRWDALFYEENGFHMTGKLTNDQKMQYFDWIQRKNNLWYVKIWDYLHAKYPSLDLFIYPDKAALGEDDLTEHPRPAYWDIYDLIVTKQKKYKIISESYNINDPYGAFRTAAESAYLRDATQGKVPFYIILQCHKAKWQFTAPNNLQIQSHIFASLVNGAEGIGFWASDMDSGKDIYETNKDRWESLFHLIEKGLQFSAYENIKPDLYVLRPYYTKYLEDLQGESSMEIFSQLYMYGFSPGFILDEQARRNMLPADSKVIYIPSSYRNELPESFQNLKTRGYEVFRNDTFDHFKERYNVLISPAIKYSSSISKERINMLLSPKAILLHNPYKKKVTLDINFMEKNLKITLFPESLIILDSLTMYNFL